MPAYRQVTVQVVSEVEHAGPTPFCQAQEVVQVSLRGMGATAEHSVLGAPMGLPEPRPILHCPSQIPRGSEAPPAGRPAALSHGLTDPGLWPWCPPLVSSPSQSGRGSACPRKVSCGPGTVPCASRASPPCGLTPAPGIPRCGKQTTGASPWPCSPSCAPREPGGTRRSSLQSHLPRRLQSQRRDEGSQA